MKIPPSSSLYSSLIDPAEFGQIADYLRIPSADIQYLVHVKSEAMLGPLADELFNHAAIVGSIPEGLSRGFRDGSILISSHLPLPGLDPQRIVPVTSVPRDALCHVIYLPPVYLVHTPGLFEGTIQKATVKSGIQQKQARRMKI